MITKNQKAAELAAPTKKVTQVDRLEGLLRTEGGVAMLEISGALGVQPHTARAMISGLRKNRGLQIQLLEHRYSVTEGVAGTEAPATG